MKKVSIGVALVVLTGAFACAEPLMDGRIASGEYGGSVSVIDGAATVYYQFDSRGGLYLAVTAPTSGWVGLGLGSVVMDGAHIYMGYIKNGRHVFSEQIGAGHSHGESAMRFADEYAIGQSRGNTTIEFHVPANRVPYDGKTVSFIVAFSGAADLSTFHEDNHDGGTIPAP